MLSNFAYTLGYNMGHWLEMWTDTNYSYTLYCLLLSALPLAVAATSLLFILLRISFDTPVQSLLFGRLLEVSLSHSQAKSFLAILYTKREVFNVLDQVQEEIDHGLHRPCPRRGGPCPLARTRFAFLCGGII